MKTFISLFFLVSLLLIASFVSAQTIVPPGPVSGTWTAAGSPYLVQGEINIPTNNTLNIESGVEVNFQGHYKFIVNGYLEAIGTEQENILFTAADTSIGWHGLRFISAQDTSELYYCIIEYGKAIGSTDVDSCGGGIYGENSNVSISNCHISNNTAYLSGGGLLFWGGSEVTMTRCTVMDNQAEWCAGGVWISSGSVATITDCEIAFNTADQGGGLYIIESDATVTGCDVHDNSSSSNGGGGIVAVSWENNTNASFSNCTITSNQGNGGPAGGIWFAEYGAQVIGTMQNCVISDNHCDQLGGGIYNQYCYQVTIDQCTISENAATTYGGGFMVNDGSLNLNHCVVSGNSASNDGGGLEIWSSTPTISNCTIFDNEAPGYGAQIDCWSGGLDAENSIVGGNSNNASIYFNTMEPHFDYCDFYNSGGPDFAGAVPTGLGVITGVNANGDPCDDYMNILEDPDFVYPVQSDYRLAWGSPCIDAGDPVSPLDPDGTCCDMGAFCYDQSMFQRILLTPFDTPIEIAASGGSFDYAIQVTNIATVSLNMDIWCDVTLPNGNIYGPVLGPFNDINVGSEVTISRERTQAVPAGAPPGIYTYNAYAVSESDTSFDSFTFVKLAADGSDWYSGWFNTGEDFGDIGGVTATDNLPKEYALHSPYPNPFNPVTTINYDLPKGDNISLIVFDVMGREIAKLVNGYKSAGTHSINFNASNLVSGVYFVRLEAGDFSQVQKVVLMK